jgi:hypothetical protein
LEPGLANQSHPPVQQRNSSYGSSVPDIESHLLDRDHQHIQAISGAFDLVVISSLD